METKYTREKLLTTPQELQKKLAAANLCLVDVRPAEEFARGHIPGAVHFDLFGLSLVDTSAAPPWQLWVMSFIRSTTKGFQFWTLAAKASISALACAPLVAARYPARFISNGPIASTRRASSDPTPN